MIERTARPSCKSWKASLMRSSGNVPVTYSSTLSVPCNTRPSRPVHAHHTHAHTRALTCCVTVCGVCATQIYKEGGFFKPHVDTPQHLQSIVAMLVLCLPSAFEGVCVCVVCVSVCVCMCVRVVFNLCAICYFSRLCSAAHVCESVHQQRTCVSAACACAS